MLEGLGSRGHRQDSEAGHERADGPVDPRGLHRPGHLPQHHEGAAPGLGGFKVPSGTAAGELCGARTEIVNMFKV